MRHTCTLTLLALALMLSACAQADAAMPKHLRMVIPFDESFYACEGAANPYPAAGHVKLVPGGVSGKALRFTGQDNHPNGKARFPWEKSAMVIDGENVPKDRGTVGLHVRFSGKRNWKDGKRTWLLALVPAIGSSQTILKDNGTGLAVFKDKDNALVLGVYQFYKKRLTPGFRSRKSAFEVAEPDAIVARIPAKTLSARSWQRIRVGWDRTAGRAWLSLNDTTKSGKVKFRPADWFVMLVGTPPRITHAAARGFDGDADDLVIDARTPEQTAKAGWDLPAKLPPAVKSPGGKVPAVHLKDDPVGAQMESVVRSHLANVIRMQEPHGGWIFSGSWPSGMWFLSSKVVIPNSPKIIILCKDGNSSYCATMIMAGYLTLGDKQYLDAAERTAAALLKAQYADGHWPYSAIYDPEKDTYTSTYGDERAPLEDHVQSHPTALLWLLHQVTGKKEYLVAADKGRDFIYKAQNPNGSWSHHWNTKLKCGQAAQGKYLRAGEINDDTTADQMLIMLCAYRRSGDIKYLASYLRGADWLVSAFIDEKGKGWAQQYDENNKPIPARHFEPPAIGLSEGTHSAPRSLLRTYKMTGDKRYLVPCQKWYTWMMDNRVFQNKEKTKWGWFTYYDPKDGKPFGYTKRKRMTPDPRTVREGGFTSVLRDIRDVHKPKPKKISRRELGRRILAAEEKAKERTNEPVTNRLRPIPLVRMFDWHVGSWAFGKTNPTGTFISPSTVRVALVAWSVFLRRQIRGQIPYDHPMGELTRYQWGSPFCYVVTPEELFRPLTKDEVARARASIAKNK